MNNEKADLMLRKGNLVRPNEGPRIGKIIDILF